MRHSRSSPRWLGTSFLTFFSLGQLKEETRAEPKAEHTFTPVLLK